MSKKANLVGCKFNMLTVIDGFHDKEKHQMLWKCKCDCGNNKVIFSRGADLKNGKTKSCGCYKAKRLFYGESAFNRLYDTYRRRALQKNLPFELSKEEFKKTTLKNCFYCNVEPKQKTTKGNGRGYGEYIYNGIDRIDSSKGYTLDNIVPCCGQCNVAKNNYSQEEFIFWISKVYSNFNIDKIKCKKLENLKI